MENLPDFIIIDDDYINNVICQLIIQNELQATKIDIFTIPQKGIEHIKAKYSKPDSHDAILFLDINMPALNGWDVLEEIKNAPEWVEQHVKIFIFSSSATPKDKQNAADDPRVSGYVEKPLTQMSLLNIIENKDQVINKA